METICWEMEIVWKYEGWGGRRKSNWFWSCVMDRAVLRENVEENQQLSEIGKLFLEKVMAFVG